MSPGSNRVEVTDKAIPTKAIYLVATLSKEEDMHDEQDMPESAEQRKEDEKNPKKTSRLCQYLFFQVLRSIFVVGRLMLLLLSLLLVGPVGSDSLGSSIGVAAMDYLLHVPVGDTPSRHEEQLCFLGDRGLFIAACCSILAVIKRRRRVAMVRSEMENKSIVQTNKQK